MVDNHGEAGVYLEKGVQNQSWEQVRRLRNLLWLAIMLALYYMRHYGSLQMTFASKSACSAQCHRPPGSASAA